MSDKTLIQTIKLKIDGYIDPLRKINSETKSTMGDIGKALTGNSQSFSQNETQVKKWGKSVTDELSSYGNKMRENFATGLKMATLDFGRDAIKKAGGDAIEMAFSFSKAFAEIKSRSNASEQDLQKWKRSIMQISTDTTANMDSMAESFKDMFSSVKNPEELLKIMDSIGKAAAMGDGDATKVSGFVKNTLQGQGREVNKANVDDVLGASDVLRRHGNGFRDLDDSMSAMTSMSGQDIAKSKLSERDLAAIIAGATKTGSSKGAAIKGISDLISASNNGIMEGSVLGSVLGSGKLTDKSGKFDVNKLGKKGAYQKLLNYGGGDENKAREIFAKISGLSAESSNAIFNMVKNFKDLSETVQKASKDQKSFAKSAEEGKDNLINAYSGFKNNLITGVTDMLGGFETPFKNLLKGNIGGAITGAPNAFKQLAGGVSDHPALVATTIATVMGGGALLGSLLSKIGGGGKLGTAAGVAQGMALKQAGVDPVFVVNAGEISEGVGNAASASSLGFMQKLGLVGAAGATGFAIGSGINEVADSNAETNKYGQKYNIFEKGMAKIIPEALGGMNAQDYKDNYTPQKVIVEIHSKDPAFRAIPKAGDTNRGNH